VRYTLQWLDPPEPYFLLNAPNNIDATFIPSTRKQKPSGLLLHYNYGAAAVKRWGHGVEVLEAQPNPARPTVPIPAPMGAPKAVHDRNAAIENCDAAKHTGPTNLSTGNAPGGVWTRRTRHDGMRMMLCFSFGETHQLQQNDTARSRRTVPNLWKSEAGDCLHTVECSKELMTSDILGQHVHKHSFVALRLADTNAGSRLYILLVYSTQIEPCSGKCWNLEV
jgi:hypothetical protein